MGCIASSVKKSLWIDILSFDIFFRCYFLSILAGNSQFILYTEKRKIGNKYLKLSSKSFKFKFGLVALSKVLSGTIFKIAQFMTIA